MGAVAAERPGTSPGALVRRAFAWYSARARERRARIFRARLRPDASDRILDLGSGDGAHIASIVPFRENVVLADISSESLDRGRTRYGFDTVRLEEGDRLPFADGEFDVVFCSSVIEHVTVPKTELERYRAGRAFREVARASQRGFADEIRRVGKRYFVQTPYRYFPIESHTWLPFPVGILPRPAQIATIHVLNRFWPKKTSPDWYLLTRREMRELFPDAEIVAERSCGLVKSLIAVRA